MNTLWMVGITTAMVSAVAFQFGRKSRNEEVDKIRQSISTKDFQLGELKSRVEESVACQRALEVAGQTNIQKIETTLARCKSKLEIEAARVEKLEQDKKQLLQFIEEALNKLRSECSNLPYAVRWFLKLQEAVDALEVERLASQETPSK
jgi:uncharacterized protein (UPF0335 family)